MTLGKTLRQLREDRGWTQGQLALHSEVDQSHLSKIERDVFETVNARVLARIATALDVSADYLMSEAGWMPDRPHAAELAASEQRFIDTMRMIKSDILRRRVLEQVTAMVESVLNAETTRDFANLRRMADGSEPYRES